VSSSAFAVFILITKSYLVGCCSMPGHAVLPRRVYFLSAAFFSAGALDADFAIDVVGTMMWAYGVPFHITHGPPLVQSVGYASS
jgi:hypothetical protein